MAPLLVLDASTLLTPILEEPLQEHVEALYLLFGEGRLEILEPSLWYYEIGNTLRRYSTRFPDAHTVHRAYSALHEVGFRTKDPAPKEIAQAFEILTHHPSVSFYDAIYHAMAIVHRGICITGDRRYAKHVSRFGHLMTLDDLPPYLARVCQS